MRPFNHIGPRQSPQFVVANFAQQISQIKLGKRQPVLEVGDIDVRREFTDVRDVVEAYRFLLEYGCSGEVKFIMCARATSGRFVTFSKPSLRFPALVSASNRIRGGYGPLTSISSLRVSASRP